MPAVDEWPRAFVVDPPAPMVAAWLKAMHSDATHQEIREAQDSQLWVTEQHAGYVVRLCSCGHWYITASSVNPGHCGGHEGSV